MPLFRLDIPAYLMMTFSGATKDDAIAAARQWCDNNGYVDVNVCKRHRALVYPTEIDKIEVIDIYDGPDCEYES